MASEYIGDNPWIPQSDEDNTSSNRLIWTTQKVNDLIVALDQGYKPKVAQPFYEGNPNLRKANIVFEYADEEIEEMARCANDIVYFAENYSTVMTDEGIRKVSLRDYQKRMLRNFENERFNIVLASRQMGKCSFYDTKVTIKNSENQEITISIGQLYFSLLRLQRRLTWAEWAKWNLWKLYDKL